ncbi:MAG: gamma-glutamyl-gamma-aminobutyrate hydrolase family protein [Acidobacteria bacterium]|nr:gamma-glutamyl-gamma-aminobutyrate hydrolase family protein [Acidobacteriota bacterium]
MKNVKCIVGLAFPRPDYVSALEAAGAEVRVLSPATDVIEDVVPTLDGVLLTGGPDVRPSLYGAEQPHPTVEVDDERDAYELPLARAVLAHGVPLLAICRGAQVLNVAGGGTLVQDLPSETPSAIGHSLLEPRHAIAHPVTLARDSALAAVLAPRLVGAQTIDVNSRHHQAVAQLAPGFRVSATAPDGTVEAIEPVDAATRPFCIGVQWHPENFWRTGEFAPLFSAFVEASRAHATRAGAPAAPAAPETAAATPTADTPR